MRLHQEDHRGLLERADNEDNTVDGYCSGAEIEKQDEYISFLCKIPLCDVTWQSTTPLYEELCGVFLGIVHNNIIRFIMANDVIKIMADYMAQVDISCLQFLEERKRGCSTNGSKYCQTGESYTTIVSAEVLTHARFKQWKKWSYDDKIKPLPRFAKPKYKITLNYRSELY